MTADLAWVMMLRALKEGVVESPRGMRTRELLNYSSRIDMSHPIVTIKGRKLNYRFMAAEPYWYLSGSDLLSGIEPWMAKLYDYSDDKQTLYGAYGPRILDQLEYVVSILSKDPSTRQAVMTLWRQNPKPSKDIPCTVSLQFLIRQYTIHAIANMRSSDAWLGWPYDVFSFIIVAQYVRACLRRPLKPGTLYLNAGSQHLYETHWEVADKLMYTPGIGVDFHEFEGLTYANLIDPDHIMNALGSLRNTEGLVPQTFKSVMG